MGGQTRLTDSRFSLSAALAQREQFGCVPGLLGSRSLVTGNPLTLSSRQQVVGTASGPSWGNTYIQ